MYIIPNFFVKRKFKICSLFLKHSFIGYIIKSILFDEAMRLIEKTSNFNDLKR